MTTPPTHDAILLGAWIDANNRLCLIAAELEALRKALNKTPGLNEIQFQRLVSHVHRAQQYVTLPITPPYTEEEQCKSTSGSETDTSSQYPPPS